MDDLLQFGNEGLMVAAEKWVPKGNIKFASYARRIIERFIRRGVENTDNLIRLPVNIGEEIRHMKYNDRYLSQKLGRDPSSAELAIFIGGSVRRIDYLKTLLLREPISLDALVGKKLIEEDEYE
jgi:RNA polymerase primary sigma factor